MPKTFICCRCGLTKPYVQAWCSSYSLDDPATYWCDECENKSQVREEWKAKEDPYTEEENTSK